jgi:ectoine hydroxylase-related dioxygenase (phytanoyl-CoA dioxygenase family)
VTPTVDCRQPDWLEATRELIGTAGFAAVTGVLPEPLLNELRPAMYRVQASILNEVGADRLQRAGELGVLRLMVRFDPLFLRVLETPELLQAIDSILSPNAILHLQNGFILPSFAGQTPQVFQNRFHQDFPRVLNGALMSINIMLAIDEFTAVNGATLAIPGSQQHALSEEALERLTATAIPATCPAGSMLVFDSTLWHAAGANTSGADRLAINHQFTHSYIKQQIDYVRALGTATVESLPPRTQQMLGWYTRVVTSLDEYYRPEAQRLYRRGQG